MKKLLSFVLCFAMLFSLAACGQGKQPEENPGKDDKNNVSQSKEEKAFEKLKNIIIEKGTYNEEDKEYTYKVISNIPNIGYERFVYNENYSCFKYEIELSDIEVSLNIYSDEFYVSSSFISGTTSYMFFSDLTTNSTYHNSTDLQEKTFMNFTSLSDNEVRETIDLSIDTAFKAIDVALIKNFSITLSDLGFTSFDADYNKTEDKTQNNDAELNKPKDTQTKPNTSTNKPNTSTNTQTKPNTSTSTETKPNTSVSTLTTGQRNALREAKTYLDVMAFSYEGLISQLEYAKYSHEDAVYAADNCGANWKEQALKDAKNYIDVMAFSYTGLISQLEFAKYTSEQAKYGADNCGADWNEQAKKAAKEYLDVMAFSRDGLIDQLEFAGFTHDQAVYGVTANGY